MIGQYLALLYYCKDKNKQTIDTLKIKFKIIIDQMKITNSYNIAGEVKNYTSVSNIKKYIVLGTQKKNMFHLLLYCLWWISNISDHIVQYYEGIRVTFNEINETESCETNIIQIREEDYSQEIFTEYTEEELQIIDGYKITDFNIALVKILSTSNFEEIHYTSVATPEDKTKTFSDCVETGLRNFINILIFNNNNLNIEILLSLGAIQPLIDYYTI